MVNVNSILQNRIPQYRVFKIFRNTLGSIVSYKYKKTEGKGNVYIFQEEQFIMAYYETQCNLSTYNGRKQA
jgi:hypothetical protein